MKIFEIKPTSKRSRIYICGLKIISIPIKIKEFVINTNKEKFGVSYSVFDGEELLEESIRSIRNEVDYINIVYQTTSWYGNKCSKDLLPTIDRIKEKGLVDEIIFFEPDLKKSPQFNEAKKRNIGLKYAINSKTNYFMTMDCDEMYKEAELKTAKEYLLDKNITHSYCKQIQFNEKKEVLPFINAGFIQFFSKVDKHSLLGDNHNCPCLVDPTRMVLDRKNSKHYMLHNISMLHYSLFRKDLKSKFVNSSNEYIRDNTLKSV